MEEKYYRLVEVDAPAQQEYHPTTKLDVVNNAISSIGTIGVYGAFLYFVYKILTVSYKEVSNDREESAGEA